MLCVLYVIEPCAFEWAHVFDAEYIANTPEAASRRAGLSGLRRLVFFSWAWNRLGKLYFTGQGDDDEDHRPWREQQSEGGALDED